MILSQLIGDKVISSSSEAFSLYEKSCFGEKKENKIEYSPVESLFLVSKERMQVFFKNKQLTFESLLSKLRKIDKKIELKNTVFEDLRKKGYIPKAALKYGSDFRIYDKGTKPGKDHAPWILFVTKDSHQITWQEFAAKIRISHSVKKKLLIALVDQEGDVSYYQTTWFKT